MIYQNNDRLREYLDRGAAGAYREHLRHPRFEFNDESFAAALDQVCAQFPDLPPEDAEARAAFRLLTSGAAPEIAAPLPSPWYRARTFVCKKCTQNWPWLKLAWAVAVLALCATAVALLSALVVRAEPTPQHMQAYRNAVRGLSLLGASPAGLAAQQPGGLIVQFQQGGSVLATRPAGLIALNCATGMSCSFSGTTFTLTSTGAGGSGCTPPGTPSRFLYDDGAGNCLDSGLTWTSGSSTATAPSGVTLTYSGTGIINARRINGTEFTNMESLGKIPIGQGDGTAVWADPLVQGLTAHDAVATSTNPVVIGGYASTGAPADVSADGDAVRGWFLRNGSLNIVNRNGSGGEIFTAGAPGAVNVQALNGSTIATNSGVATAGTLRTVLATDVALPAGNNNIGDVDVVTLPNVTVGTFPDNEPFNVAQMNGVAVSMGNGVSGTGVQRVTIASDSTGQVAVASLPNEGQQTMANSVSVAIASNQSAVPASQSGTWNITNVSGTVSLPTGASTLAEQQTQSALLSSIDTKAVQQRTADYDTGAGTVNTNYVGIALPASGGPVAGGTATNPVRTDPTGTTTQPVSGTVGVSGNVTVVQGTGSNLHVVCDSGCGGTGGTSAADNSAFTGGSTSVTPMGAVYDTTPPAITDGNVGAPVMDSSRRLIVNCATGCGGSGGTSSTFGSAFPSDGTAAGFSDGTNMQGARVFDADSGGGTQYVAGVSLRKIASGGSVEAGTASDPLRIDPTGTTTQPISAASLPLPTGAATESTLSTLNGKVTAVDTGNVTIAALPNEGQQTMANSVSVAIASNQSAVPVSQSGTWSLAANQSVNLAQVAGNTTLTGNGASGTGAQRVTLSSDNTAIANWGLGATGSAVPAGAQQIAGVGTGNLTAPLACDSYAFYDANTNGATQLVALTSSQTIYVCGYSFSSSSTTANTVKLVYGTGTNCGTGQTAMTPGTVLQAAASTGPVGKVIPVSGWSRGLKTAASNALCVLTNAAAAAQVEVWYTKF